MNLKRFSKTDKLLRYRTLLQKMYPLQIFSFTRAKWKWMHRQLLKNYRHRITRYNRSISFRNLRRRHREKGSKHKLKLTVRSFYVKLRLKSGYSRKKIKNFFPVLQERKAIKEWGRKRSLYRENLRLKRSIGVLSDFLIKCSRIKQKLNSFKLKENKKLYFFLHIFYRLDYLLWVLGYCKNRLLIRYFISEGKVLVNGECVSLNYFLKEGDIITFMPNKFYMREAVRYYKNEYLLSFIECDYYSNVIIITKDLNKLTDFDLTNILKETKVKVML